MSGSSQSQGNPSAQIYFLTELDSSYLPTQREFGLSTLTEILPDGLDGLSLNEVRYLEPRLLTPRDHSEFPKDATRVFACILFSLGDLLLLFLVRKNNPLSLPPRPTVNIKFNPRLSNPTPPPQNKSLLLSTVFLQLVHISAQVSHTSYTS